MRGEAVSFVIPAYNEEVLLPGVVRESLEELDKRQLQGEVLILDDCSSDRTPEEAEKLAEADPRVRVIRNPERLGCHPSQWKGFLQARGPWLLFIPADGQIPPSEIEAFLAGAGEADVVLSWRKDRADPWHRRLIAQGYRLAIRLTLGLSVHDVDSCTLYRKPVIEAMAGKVDPLGPFLPTEMLYRAKKSGARVNEVVIRHLPRRAGKPSSILPLFLLKLPFRFARFLWRIYRT